MGKRANTIISAVAAIALLTSGAFALEPSEASKPDFFWPTPTVTDIARGYPQGHRALDIAAPYGTAVLASREGIIEFLYTGCNNQTGTYYGSCSGKGLCTPSHGSYGGYCNEGFGNSVILKHPDGSYTAYAHFIEAAPDLKEGALVKQGQYIGLTGTTGRASGAHLHFECRSASDGGFWRAAQYDPMTVVSPPQHIAPSFGSFEAFNPDSPKGEFDFPDVNEDDWYYDTLSYTCSLGLLKGLEDGTFSPDGNMTLGQTVKVASTLHSLYYYKTSIISEYGYWYQAYADYALIHKLTSLQRTIEPRRDYDAVVTRAQFIDILARALPDEALPVINNVPDGAIPDVPMSAAYAPQVYKLYRAGILRGSDMFLNFNGNQEIKRSEAATLLARMADIKARVFYWN